MDYVYDIEFYSNFFCVNFKSFPDGEHKITFEISSRKDERKELLEFLETEGLRLIGYNNVGYDYPVLHMLIESPEISLLIWWKKVQRTIFNERKGMIWDNKRKVFQIDLFKINHYDNMARSTSLKWLEFTQRWHRVQDLPFDPKDSIQEVNMDSLIEYCWNDVDYTFAFAESCWGAVKFRENMSKVLGRNVMDYSDVKIGEYLNQKKYEELSGRKYKEFKEERTYRQSYDMKDIIPDVIEFKTEFMQGFLETLKARKFVDNDKFRYDIIFNKDGFVRIVEGGLTTPSGLNDKKAIAREHEQGNSIINFAKGGLHSIDHPKVVDRKQGFTLVEKDVGSMYPRGIVVDGIYPRHLGKNWNQGISDAYDYRVNVLKPKLKELEYKSDEWNKVNDEQEVYKLAMNGGGFGKLGSAFSWQYDPLAKYKVTMGCELKLLMFIEQCIIHKGIIEVVSVNTDGVVIHYPNNRQSTVDGIHKWWEEKTGFMLEDTHYSKLVYSSVNDYIAVIVDPETDKQLKVKYKGDFEINKDPHKNNSQRIVAIALSEYFVNGVGVTDVVGHLGYEFDNEGTKEQVSIYDYCIGRKKTSSCEYWLVSRGKAHKLKDKVIRYYISKQPNQLLKRYTKGKSEGRSEKVNAGFDVTMFMDYFPPSGSYKIDKLYYKNEVQKIINAIESGTRMMKGGTTTQGDLF